MLQPSEAHIPYVLQFLIDFNIQGMNYIHLKSAVCRKKPEGDYIPTSNRSTSTAHFKQMTITFVSDRI